jgi:hypothetical protein
MRSIALLGALAVFGAMPLAAQRNFRTDTGSARRAPTTAGSVLGRVLGQGQDQTTTESRKSDHIPPGQRPPAGMCRVWIDGVPPGQQPAPTDCQTAVATKPANARVLFGGDGTSFPGKGKGKLDKRDREDDDEIESESRRGGVIGGVIPGTTQQQAVSGKEKGHGKKGRGRGGN